MNGISRLRMVGWLVSELVGWLKFISLLQLLLLCGCSIHDSNSNHNHRHKSLLSELATTTPPTPTPTPTGGNKRVSRAESSRVAAAATIPVFF